MGTERIRHALFTLLTGLILVGTAFFY